MQLAVAQLAVIYICSLVPFLGLLLDAGNLLALLLCGNDLLLKNWWYLLVHVEVVVEIGLYEVVDECPDSRTFVINDVAILILGVLLPHVCGTELSLCLTFEVRLLDLYADGSDDALADVFRCIIFLEEFLECLDYGFSEGCQMSTSLACVLTVHE